MWTQVHKSLQKCLKGKYLNLIESLILCRPSTTPNKTSCYHQESDTASIQHYECCMLPVLLQHLVQLPAPYDAYSEFDDHLDWQHHGWNCTQPESNNFQPESINQEPEWEVPEYPLGHFCGFPHRKSLIQPFGILPEIPDNTLSDMPAAAASLWIHRRKHTSWLI